MQTVRYSARCGVTDRVRRALLRLLPALALCVTPAAPAAAQETALRLTGATVPEVAGTRAGGAAAYPAATLELLGFTLASTPAALTAVLGSDTLRFWHTSAFFRAGTRVHQLVLPVTFADGTTWLPEQLFIQWLPTAFPDRFAFQGGALAVRSALAAAAPAAPSAPAAPAAPAARRTDPPAAAAPGGQAPGGQAPETAAPRQAASPPQRPGGTEPRVVIIDPGHGGRDPGKIGPNGLREKDVTLLVSQRVAAVLRDRGYEVHLTRTTDTLIALADRPRMANRWRGDRQGAVFLSIHANSAPSTTARGFETFFLSEARTEDERRVAELENAAIRFEDPAARSSSGNGLDQILSNLHGDFLTRASHDLAAVMQEKLATFHPGPNRGVKRAGFYVLVGAIMPAVLIETAFLSHRDEANLLGTQSFQQSLAWGIADGVDEFFRRNEHLWSQQP
jgi:N-acetylmuramoyl-L-alanine amidase